MEMSNFEMLIMYFITLYQISFGVLNFVFEEKDVTDHYSVIVIMTVPICITELVMCE